VQAEGVDLDARATLDADPDAVHAALADLGTYPQWLGIVATSTPDDGADEPAWHIELVGRIGPFTKRKRVRMVRTDEDPTTRTVRFERRERDDRHHNAWVLTGACTPDARIHVHLHYGGGRQLPGADLLLRQEVRNAGARLQAYLDGHRSR
jgi:hypothetical protein